MGRALTTARRRRPSCCRPSDHQTKRGHTMKALALIMALASGCGPVTKGEGCKLTCDAWCTAQSGCLSAECDPVDSVHAACVARGVNPADCPVDQDRQTCIAIAAQFSSPTCSPACQTQCCVGPDCAEQIAPARATACAEGWAAAKCGSAGAYQPEACK